jgi:hypothetical protein
MRDYLYISTRKVEVLGGQIEPSFWERLEPTVGLKAFWLTLGVTLRERPASRYSILQAVTKKLAQDGDLGQLDDCLPLRRYVQGTMEMRYGFWPDGEYQLVWFLGSDKTHLIGIGGRIRHLVEVYEDELRKGQGPMLPSEKHNAAALASHLKPDKDEDKVEGRGSPWTYDLDVLDGVFHGDDVGSFEFVTRVDDAADVVPTGDFVPGLEPPGRRYVIGSPLWIAKI